MLALLQAPWPWYVGGAMISGVMVLLLFLGKSFGISATMHATCAALGGGKNCEFFAFDWKKTQAWNLVFGLGVFLGGFIAAQWLASPEPVQISAQTVEHLQSLGISTPKTLAEGTGYIPSEFMNSDFIWSWRGLSLFIFGGFLVGFGARYAGGCTSGHAISGLSNLQLPSLIAVVGFFIGGLTMVYLVLPYLMPFLLQHTQA